MMLAFRAVGFLLALALLPLRSLFWSLSRRIPSGAWITVEVDGPLVDVVDPITRIFRPRALSLEALARAVDALSRDARVGGVLVIVRRLGGGMATATSLRELLARLRSNGKEVVVHLPLGGGSKEIYVATAASRIYVGPQSTVAPLGFASSTLYFGKAMERLGAQAKITSRGKYKSAGETLVREAMSDAQREQIGEILDQFYEALLHGIASGRGISRERAAEIVDRAPYRPAAAVEAGLVDGHAYEDMLPGLLVPGKAAPPLVPLRRYLRAMDARLLPSLRLPSVVGVVAVHGPIVGSGPGVPRGRGDDAIIANIRVARMLPSVKAVVLHVDSPGGSVLASDRIHHELEQLAREKPLVAYFGNVAASGGYYVAAAAQHIVAQPTTITGSIGVVAARVAVEPLLARLGVRAESVRRGARVGLLDPFRPLTEDEEAALDREIGAVYDDFVDLVARGRKRPRSEVLDVAEGRVWSGEAAHARGLVDQLGGFDVALEVARERGRVPNAPPVLLRALRSHLPPLAPPRALTWLDTAPVDDGALALLARSVLASGEQALAWCHLGRFIG
jgi:protease-4